MICITLGQVLITIKFPKNVKNFKALISTKTNILIVDSILKDKYVKYFEGFKITVKLDFAHMSYNVDHFQKSCMYTYKPFE